MAGLSTRPAATDRLIRALQRGGMAVEIDGRWAVYRSRDRRTTPIGAFDPAALEALRAAGSLRPLGDGGDGGDQLCWSGPVIAAPEAPASTPDVPGLSRAGASRWCKPPPPRRSPLQQVFDALPGERERTRARNVALRLEADLQRAAAAQSVTMRWDPAGAIDGTPSRGEGGQSLASAKASRRIGRVQSQLRGDDWVAAVALVIQHRPIARIAADLQWPKKTTASRLGSVLLRLADAYDR